MRILISGAGVAGPTLAWFLTKAGDHRITIVEKSQSLLPHGQNVDISGSAVTAIKQMGLLDQVRKFNTKELGTKFINSNGESFAPFPVKEGSSASFTSEFEILRGDLAAILYKATADHPQVEYRFGTMIKNVLLNDDTGVSVEMNDGKVEDFDLLVAADGQWSKVRKQCFQPEEIKSSHKGMYSVYFTVPRLPQDDDWWNIFIALGSRIITLRPDPHGTTRALFTIMPRNEAQEKEWRGAARSDRKAQEALLTKEFADAGWEAQRLLGVMNEAPDFYFQEISQIRMSTWSSNRVVCLGDTAYAPTPLTGMGTSLAIIGAYVLAGELSQLHFEDKPTKALQAYEDRFRPFVQKSQEIPPLVPSFAHPETAWRRWILHAFIRLISSMVAVPWILSRLGGDVDAESRDDGFQLPKYSAFAEFSNAPNL